MSQEGSHPRHSLPSYPTPVSCRICQTEASQPGGKVTEGQVCLKNTNRRDALSDPWCGSTTWPQRALCSAWGSAEVSPSAANEKSASSGRWPSCVSRSLEVPQGGQSWEKLVRKNECYRSFWWEGTCRSSAPKGAKRSDRVQEPTLKYYCMPFKQLLVLYLS